MTLTDALAKLREDVLRHYAQVCLCEWTDDDFAVRTRTSEACSIHGTVADPLDAFAAAVVEAERERDQEKEHARLSDRLLDQAGKRLEALTEAVDAYSAFDDVIAVLADARREQTRRLEAARVVLAGGTEPDERGCPRHKGKPHNLCEACWAVEPDEPETVEIGDDRDGRRVAEEGQP